MALPREAPLSEALREARTRWTQVKTLAENVHTVSLEGPIGANRVLGLHDNLRLARTYFQGLATVPGIGAYAQDQYGDGYAIGPDFDAFVAALTVVIDWIATAVPKDANNYLLVQRLAANGDRIDRTFSTTDTAGLRTVLDALIATVE